MSRSKLLKIGLFVAVGVIAVRLFVIQILEHDKWVAMADEQHTMQNTILAKRGEIYMMEGEEAVPVVMNETVFTVLVDPMTADEAKVKEVIDKYAKDFRIAKWKDVFANKELRYYVVAKEVPRSVAEQIKEEDPVGVWFQEGVRRVYPEGEMASGLLGFVNAEGKGQYGVEGSLDEALSGKNGLLKTVKDVNNIPLTIGDENVRVPAENGKNLVLTVDKNIQNNVERLVRESMDEYHAAHAAAIVMNPQNGKVLAMVNLPNYDPAEYGKVEDAAQFVNYTLEDPYEPASVCKTFTFAAAVEEGKMTPETTYVNNGYTTVDGWDIANAEKGQLGTIPMQTAFNYSLNTGSMQALMWLGGNANEITQAGREKLYEYYHDRFGFGEATGIELLESGGLIVGPNTGYGLNSRYANMTFGQNLDLTMLQVASAFSAVVNGGHYYTPTVVEGEMVDGELKKKVDQPAVREVVSEKTSATMRQMLWGTRSARRILGIDRAGYYVGGKTGTAQIIRDGKYVMDETAATYIGYGGAGNSAETAEPEYVVMVRIWEQGKAFEGQLHALPMFDKISNYMQEYLRIKPAE